MSRKSAFPGDGENPCICSLFRLSKKSGEKIRHILMIFYPDSAAVKKRRRF